MTLEKDVSQIIIILLYYMIYWSLDTLIEILDEDNTWVSYITIL